MKHSAISLAIPLALFLCFTQVSAGRTHPDSPAEEPQLTASQPTVKEGGKDDIDAIGNRDIGGRGLGNWYSLATEIKLGKQYAQMTDNTVKLVRDPTAEFDDVRARLAMIENRHRMGSEQKESKPTLRRAPKPAEESDTDEDRPTLKRREDDR